MNDGIQHDEKLASEDDYNSPMRFARNTQVCGGDVVSVELVLQPETSGCCDSYTHQKGTNCQMEIGGG